MLHFLQSCNYNTFILHLFPQIEYKIDTFHRFFFLLLSLSAGKSMK